jgi:hypothetical protein
MMKREQLLDVFAISAFGRGREEGKCVCHGHSQTRTDFKDEASWREFSLSHLCQVTQDEVFEEDEPSVEVDLQEAYRRNPFRE